MSRPWETVHRLVYESQGIWLFGPIFKVSSVDEIIEMTEWFIRYFPGGGAEVRVDRHNMGTSKMGLCFHNVAAAGQAARMLDRPGIRQSCNSGCGLGWPSIQKGGFRAAIE